MKLILVLAAACSAVSAMNLRQVVPSSAPGPERQPITCAEKNAFNQICSNVGKVPTDTGFECCQWSNQCGPGVPKCLERNCCRDVGPGTGPPTPPQPENPIELPAHVMTCETKLAVNPGAFECDVGSEVRTDAFLCCQWTPNPETATRECAPFGATVKCLERTCCVTDDGDQ
ncbi:hypothetical protein SARC_10755 [Sphaeroforma arctica JP610]|uniref:Uncharacterized protein n=1 Tax=Sphaeroforma arctica JP610 TaxID=667725 RepID=A0A0L0FJV9_9EUKA|nr:hypothetical protein SARC_10755 [Sphaeroforma arctica JP610]KNC76761.1 hypothetical protein SARC_10755 [Sphaeroforma arctica JP610]|eukprot:XP_014150663.1 hypothetical protein SARC_10755 [Sphaeroforma arctica JP610]